MYGYLAEEENFIDRQEDRQQLKTFLGHGINILLISPRNKKVIIAKDFVELRNGFFYFVDPIFLLWFKQQYGINQ